MNATRSTLAILTVSIIAAQSFGQEKKPPPLTPFQPSVKVEKIHRGDVITARVNLPLDAGGVPRYFGIAGFDSNGPLLHLASSPAPEASKEEEAKGKAAMRGLQEVLDMGTVYIEFDGLGKQGDGDNAFLNMVRVLVKPDKGKVIDVAKWMIEKGHGKPGKNLPKVRLTNQ